MGAARGDGAGELHGRTAARGDPVLRKRLDGQLLRDGRGGSMNAGQTQVTVSKPKAVKKNRKTDGQDGPPRVPVQTVSGAGAQNSAAKEKPTTPDNWVNPEHPARARDIAIVDREGGLVQPSDRKKIAVCGFAS